MAVRCAKINCSTLPPSSPSEKEKILRAERRRGRPLNFLAGGPPPPTEDAGVRRGIFVSKSLFSPPASQPTDPKRGEDSLPFVVLNGVSLRCDVRQQHSVLRFRLFQGHNIHLGMIC